ncbi:hypothetical protein D4764_14G0004550 [Takifugu flavidus]|uniref:Uncharacterized protein n=1 Tax=Takifugu flavidus TaxID=433684 RepID=A0A5C6P3X1_9TELE|nr:hypothetical protein D4764_14G0004550 [Takifugu flavidus]
MLGHRLACLDPPSGMLAQVQSKMVDFFWDCLHWVPQSVSFLSRKEGGQGHIHLASRVATFRLQFVQRFLGGPPDLVWRGVASCILRRVNNLGLDAALWSFIQIDSLHWLLKEPLVCGGRLDVCSSATPALKEALIRRKMVTLEQLVAAAGPELTDAQAVTSALGVRSVRLIQRSLGLWKHRLSTKEKGLLLLHGRGEAETDPTDAFPELHLHPDLVDLGGPLLNGCGSGSLHSMDRRILYGNIVKALNKDKLKNREAIVWKDRLGGQSPQWRTLYKPPIKKRTEGIKLKNGAACDAVALWKQNVRVRLNLEFCFYKATENLEAFKQQWGHDKVLVKFEKLTRRHAVKVLPVAAVFVEEVSYAVGEVVGFESVKSASRMNSVMVIFLDNVYKVQWLVESGVTPVYPLVNPAKKITVFNTPPFIKNDDL